MAMRENSKWPRMLLGSRGRSFLCLIVAFFLSQSGARAQGPQVDVDNPPGSPDARGKLGSALGASGTSGFDATPITNQESIFSGRPGPSATRTPINQLATPSAPIMRINTISPPPTLSDTNVSRYGDIELPITKEENEGPADGLTLDRAIDILIQNNLNLLSLKYEIPMAQADVLTASLRNNPIFYADSQLVPYGHYSNARPGGDLQYDVNVTLPLDVWRKRRAKTIVAQRAKKVTEAQFQDAVRQQVDNLYTAYVDVIAARLTLQFSETYNKGLRVLLSKIRSLVDNKQKKEADYQAVRAQLEQSELQIREATQTLAKTKRTLGLLLNIPAAEFDKVDLRGKIYNLAPIPTTEEGLIETGLNSRPDLLSYRMGKLRADADIMNAKAQRFSDVYLLYQPYTFQNNNWQGLKSAYSWAIGVTVTLPVYNRNQGNILRSKLNAEQSEVELATQEKQVIYDIQEAIREFEQSRISVQEFLAEIIPASRVVLDSAYRGWQGGETSILEYLDAQQDFNEVVRQYRDALVRHRRAMLDLNTAVGTRIVQ